MIKRISLLFILFWISLLCYGEPVNKSKAIKTAVNFITKNNSNSKSYIFDKIEQKENNGSTLYVVKFKPTGFVVVSGDDRYYPFLYYSLESEYEEKNMPDGFKFLMDSYRKDIEFTVKNYETANAKIKSLWEEYSATPIFQKTSNTKSVEPLIKTRWHQTYPYNKYCPAAKSGGSGGRTYAGCVAVALAQLLKYYERPECGKGFFSYNLSGIGTISADFANTTYNWTNIVNTLQNETDTARINETAKLIYHAGVAIYTEYSGISSNATFTMAYYALTDYFYYKSGSSISKNNKNYTLTAYTDEEWLSILKSELNDNRPILYRASDNNGGGGHVFLIDGYDSENYLHVNWGWGGSFNGYYISTSLSPGNYNFSYGSQAVIGAKPLIGAISNISPVDGSGNIAKDCSISWNYSLGRNNTKYKLLLAANSGMSDVKIDESITGSQSFHLTNLDYYTKYFWKVGVCFGNNEILWTGVNCFTTINPIYYVSYLQKPENNKTDVKLPISLSWYMSSSVPSCKL